MLPAPFSGFQGGRRHPQADSSSGWAELEEGSPWGLVSSGPPGSFWLSVPTSWLHWPCCLLVTRGQPRSRHLDSGRGGRAPAVGRGGRKTFPETPSLIPFCFSLCPPPPPQQGDHGSLSLRARDCHLIPVRRKRRNPRVSSPRPYLLVRWTKPRRPRARLASPILVPLLHTLFQATGFCASLIGHYNQTAQGIVGRVPTGLAWACSPGVSTPRPRPAGGVLSGYHWGPLHLGWGSNSAIPRSRVTCSTDSASQPPFQPPPPDLFCHL